MATGRRLGSPLPMVSVVIVNWNAGPGLETTIRALAADGARGMEVVLVDNASSDDSTDAVAAAHPWVRVVRRTANGGFAVGANAGAAVAHGETLVFLNPDAIPQPGAIEALVAPLVTPAVGIAGGGLTDSNGRWQPAAARFAPVGHLLLDTTPGRLLARRRQRPHRVDWVYGTFMAVRAEVFRTLGGFDPAYFLYGEDADLCFRARTRGWATILVPRAVAAHGPNVSAVHRFGVGRAAAVMRGELQFYARNAPRTLARFRRIAAVKFGTKAVLAALLGRHRVMTAYAAVVRECLSEGAEGARWT